MPKHTQNQLEETKSKSLDILPENLFIWSKSGSESVSNEDDSNQIDIDALPIDQLISVVPKYLSLTQESMSQTGLRGRLMTYDNHLSLSGDKEVTDENEFLKLTYTESALFAYTKDLFNDPWNVKRLQDETFDSQKSEFDQLMNSQEDRGLRGMMKNWKRGVEMNYELRCHRSNLKSHKEFVSLLPVGTDREEKLKREKSERMMRDRSRQIRGLEDKVINMRRSVERDIERVGNGSEAWGWPEDIDDWRDMLDRSNREATTKQDDPVLTSPCGGANDIVFDKGEEKTMVDRVSEGNTTGLSSGLDKARDSGLDTNDEKTEVHTPRDLGGTALGPQLITRNDMTEWDHEKGGWKKPWEEKKGATLISESETAADNSDYQVFTIVSNRKEKQKKNKISNNSEQRQRCQIEPMTGRSDDLSYRVKTGKSMGSRKTRTSTASMPPTQPISTALKEHPEMNANDDKPNDLDDLVEIAHDQSDQDTASSDRADLRAVELIWKPGVEK
ncbi:hypothetical protein L486_05263 [Kwoniella mangroviensis CBS 10435]|uniref:Uncharacterized protein n=1 Tax=Kwoniella mangroviensis CBS 10435 TaxID=1331196 RepID=A0A1B9IQH9_9TREE|nr:hypothetical protein L486_05263 [Kwoniella mangroviensis CBS 10435]